MDKRGIGINLYVSQRKDVLLKMKLFFLLTLLHTERQHLLKQSYTLYDKKIIGPGLMRLVRDNETNNSNLT